MGFVLKPINEDGCTKLDANTLQEALSEAEKLIKATANSSIMNVWEADMRLNRIAAVWVPGRGGWTNM